MKGRLKVLLAATVALALNLWLASAALAHGFAPHGGTAGGHQNPGGALGILLLPPEARARRRLRRPLRTQAVQELSAARFPEMPGWPSGTAQPIRGPGQIVPALPFAPRRRGT